MKSNVRYSVKCRNLGLLVLVLTSCLAAPAYVQAQATPDPTITAEENLLKQIYADTREGRLIGTVLRQSHDAGLTPIYEKLITITKGDKQVEAFISTTLISKNSKYLDITKLLDAQDSAMIGAGLAALVEANVITDAQLLQILQESKDPALKVMAAGELNRRGVLQDRKSLLNLVNDNKDSVRYYAAISLLEKTNPEENTAGLVALNDLLSKDDPRHGPVIALMLMRVRKDKITNAVPWVQAVAKNEKVDTTVRMTAITVLLALNKGDGPQLLSEMILQKTGAIEQIKLGLIALEHAARLKPESLDTLANSKNKTVASLGHLAQQAASGKDATADFIVLLQTTGHPILLDWSLLYAERADGFRQLQLREAIVNQAAIVDRRREQDYERAAIAAEKLVSNGDTPGNADPNSPGRLVIKRLLASDNPGVVEATLLGLARSDQTNLRDLVLPVWTPKFYKKSTNEAAANLAALILAREGGKEPLTYLQSMTETAENSGYRALAGWYYAKLTNQSEALVKRVVDSAK